MCLIMAWSPGILRGNTMLHPVSHCALNALKSVPVIGLRFFLINMKSSVAKFSSRSGAAFGATAAAVVLPSNARPGPQLSGRSMQ